MEARITSGIFYKYLATDPDRTSYTVPDGVKEIARYAFSWGKNLEEIIIPDSVERIEMYAFSDCTALKRVRLPNGLKSLSNETFYCCKSLERIELPESVKKIWSSAFYGCEALKEVIFPQGLEEIHKAAFGECHSLEQIKLPPQAKIEGLAFYGCACKEIFVPNGVILDANAFSLMPELERVVIDGDNVFHIDYNWEKKAPLFFFQDCPKLREISFTEKSKKYRNHEGLVMTADGKQLVKVPPAYPSATVCIPEGVESVNIYAFNACIGVEKILLPASLKELSRRHIIDCVNLKEISIAGESQYFYAQGGVMYSRDGENLLLSVAPPQHLALPETVKHIAKMAFENAAIMQVVLPPSLQTIGERAFFRSSLLGEVMLPEQVNSIGENAFSHTDIARLVVPATVKSIGDNAFAECKNLREIQILADGSSIGEGVIKGCNDRAVIYLPNADGAALERIFNGFPQESECAVIAPLAKLSEVSTALKRMMSLGFAVADESGEFADGWEREDYIKYIKTQRKRLFELALHRRELLRLMIAYKILKLDDVKVLLEHEGCDTEARTTLLVYQNSVSQGSIADFAASMRALERAATGVKTVEELKKEWSFRKREDGKAVVFLYRGNDSTVNIPERIGKTVVAEISENIFKIARDRNVFIRKIIIPASVCDISVNAFSGCTELEEISVSADNTLYRIENGSLYRGSTLVRVPCTMPGHIVLSDRTTEILSYALEDCKKIETVDIPATVAKIGERAFSDCEMLKSVSIPDGCAVGREAFYGCRALSQIIIGKNAVLDDKAFYALKHN